VDEAPNMAHLKLNKGMKYHMKSAFGTSPDSFQSTEFLTILGMWQGSAAVGAFWGLVSSMLFRVLQQRYQPTRFPSPDPQIYTEHHGEAFVDDTTLWMMSMTASLPIVLETMQIKAQGWERLLWTTGGALNLKKCFWYGVHWDWTKTGKPQMVLDANNDELQIQLTEGANHHVTSVIKCVEVNTGRRTLGA
jgi:hypothetical protein